MYTIYVNIIILEYNFGALYKFRCCGVCLKFCHSRSTEYICKIIQCKMEPKNTMEAEDMKSD